MSESVILVTGVAGFIGSHIAEALLSRGEKVLGLDELNDYYSVANKKNNLKKSFFFLGIFIHSIVNIFYYLILTFNEAIIKKNEPI